MAYSNLIDIGVNLTHRRFDEDRAAVLGRARAAGVARMVLTGTNATESQAAAELAAHHPDHLTSTAGVHPHEASTWSQTTHDVIVELAGRKQTVAIGETGLDYCRDFSPRSDQRACFAAQLEIAATQRLPAFLHQRDAEADFLAIIRQHRDALPGAVLHCFTGPRSLLQACLDLDLHIGVTGWICDERRGGALRDCIADIPADRLMIETDAPFLLPRDMARKPASRRNEPAYLGHVLETVAALRGVSAADLAASTTRVAARFFSLEGE
jgi:TatD DNase family protein